ncbi:sigma-70 family RNA polymerase sigma factor [Streptomyces sp. MspMP-M5]|uniref:sigma-70 family RNA polymerase sigma factor n=1 Tax=unclassified Streptomyces TaxID=2593676 RepID=UPI00037595E2|nr:sigma-70 family RNA polymerase sigma factor [Streptomyces sp. MspMP-M5]MYT29610.1 sigma-70 family RNA polymerase sigma factor [Streptomyces sp. SID8354]
MKWENGTATVEAARAGDDDAREQLASAYLPLIYNVVGRALDGHADVDDVVQETMVRALESLAELREPAAFRSWLIAIAMNQVRRRWTAAHRAPTVGLDQTAERPDRSADFVDLTILRLGLSGQRREVAEATRWLDEDDRSLLSLWWLEAAGEITRPELASAIGCGTRHAAVRVQRMKQQLETGRVVVRALAGNPPCPRLTELTAAWDHAPAPLWRKRIARHARDCRACSEHWNDLLPAEGLLAGLAMLPLPAHLTPHIAIPHAPAAAASATSTTAPTTSTTAPATSTAPTTSTAPHTSSAAPTAPRRTPGPRRAAAKTTVIAGTAALTLAAIAALWWYPGAPRDDDHPAPKATPTAEPSATTTTTAPAPHPTPTPTPTPSHTLATTPTTSMTSAPPSPTTTPPDLEQQATALVNDRRAQAGCGPLHIDPRLHLAAQRHSADMAARDYFDHLTPEGVGPDARITATGYQWSRWGENLDRGPDSAATVVRDWMGDAMHRDNLLDCRFTAVGIGVAHGSGGPWWTQDLAAPR